jgi:hypothetical protein
MAFFVSQPVIIRIEGYANHLQTDYPRTSKKEANRYS